MKWVDSPRITGEQKMRFHSETMHWSIPLPLVGKSVPYSPRMWKSGRVINLKVGNLDLEDEPFFHTVRTSLDRKEDPCEFVESLHEYIARRQIHWACRYKNAGKPDKA